ncbi:hypothetical protein CDEST_10925 [Colletotrichum destructivum]|uniref:Palmitoyltransferase n=1 Tax=Colletotrichum destructivum TaxID=34406 RepID=A0AAX4IRN0_9PEZI|nr:hypothetical protein CDEST_10925 [Colletotrichum destructivum]
MSSESSPESVPLALTSPRAVLSLLRQGIFALVVAVFFGVSAWIPVLLVVDLIGHTWLVTHFLVGSYILPASGLRKGRLLFRPDPNDLPRACTLLGFYLVVLGLTGGSLAHLWWTSCRLLRKGYRFPSGAVLALKPTMQALRDPVASAHWVGIGRRPNQCLDCLKRQCPEEGGHRPILDRVYHGYTHKRKDLDCFPLWDHYCWWLWTPVCLPTQKSYLLFTVYIVIFHLVSLGIISWSLGSWWSTWTHLPYVVAALFLPMVFLWVKLAPFWGQWKNQVFRNQTHHELGTFVRNRPQPAWPIGLTGPDGFEHVVVPFNPWDLGTIGNVRAALGDHWWQWPWFWCIPRRVNEYGTNPDWDLPFGEQWSNFVEGRSFELPQGIELTRPPRAIRRRQGFSSET